MRPELLLLKTARDCGEGLAWIPFEDPYEIGGYFFRAREWRDLVRQLHQQGLLTKQLERYGGNHLRGYQKTLTCYQITQQGQKLLTELGL